MKKKKHRQIPGGWVNYWGLGPSYLLFTGSGIPVNDLHKDDHDQSQQDQQQGASMESGDGSAAGAAITGAGSGVA